MWREAEQDEKYVHVLLSHVFNWTNAEVLFIRRIFKDNIIILIERWGRK